MGNNSTRLAQRMTASISRREELLQHIDATIILSPNHPFEGSPPYVSAGAHSHKIGNHSSLSIKSPDELSIPWTLEKTYEPPIKATFISHKRTLCWEIQPFIHPI